MTSTSALLLRKYLLIWLLPAVCTIPARAQSPSEPITITVYSIKVIRQNGERCRGTIGLLTDQALDIENDPELFLFPYSGETVDLSDIKRAVIRPKRRRSARLKGAIVGGLVGLYVSVVHAPLATFRSPTLYGLNMGMIVGSGVAVGMLTGHLIGNTKRVVIRAVGNDPGVRAQQLRRQLEPYSYDYQQDMIRQAGQPPNE